MNRHGLNVLHNRLTTEAFHLMQAKNRDYGEDADPLRNFRHHGLIGIVIRLSDKLARLENSTNRELVVKSESVRDTVLDIINYAVLFLAYCEDAHERTNSGDTDIPKNRRRNGEGGGDARPVPGWLARAGSAYPVRGSGGGGKGGIKLHPSDRRRRPGDKP